MHSEYACACFCVYDAIDAVYLQCDDGDERDSCEYERYYVGLFVRDACCNDECACDEVYDDGKNVEHLCRVYYVWYTFLVTIR